MKSLCVLALLVCACSVDPLVVQGRPCDPSQPCGPGTWCKDGRCTDQWGADPCPAGQTRCSGVCVDTDTDVKHCGGCNLPCGAADDRCVAGVCVCGSGATAKSCSAGLDCVAGGCRCEAGGRCDGCCADSETCVARADRSVDRCGSGGAACESCDDKVACTEDSCSLSGSCKQTPKPGFCYIQATCFPELSANPKNPCERCEAAQSAMGWTSVLAPGCVGTAAGTGVASFLNGPAATAMFASPADVAVDAAGVIYVADTSNNMIRKVEGGQVTTLAGSVHAGLKDGPAAAAKFDSPLGVAVDSQGVVYVGDTSNHVIRKIAGGVVSTLAGDGVAGYKDGPVASARFDAPGNLVLDAAGSIYVTCGNYVVRKISGGVVSTLAGDGVAGYKDGPAASARFTGLLGLVLGKDGATIYVSEPYSDRIRVIAKGQVSTLVAGGGGYKDGPLATAKVQAPQGLAVDASGAIFVADSYNRVVRKISGGVMSTVAGDGFKSFKDGPAHLAQFSTIEGLAFSPNGDLYIAQPEWPRIRVYRP